MKYLITFAFFALFPTTSKAERTSYDLSLSKLEKLAYPQETGHANADDLKMAYGQLRSDWLAIPEGERKSHHPEYFVQMAVRYAELALQYRATDAAGSALSDAIAEAERQSITIGATKGGTSALEDTAKIVANLWSTTGANPIESKESNFAFEINKFNEDFVVVASGTPDGLADESGLPIMTGTPSIPDGEKIGFFSRIRNVSGESRLLERGYVSFFANHGNETLFDRISNIYQFKSSGVHGPSTFVQHEGGFANYLSSIDGERRRERKTTGNDITPPPSDENLNTIGNSSHFITKTTTGIVALLAVVVLSVIYLQRKKTKN